MKKVLAIILGLLILALTITAFAGGFSTNGDDDDPDLGFIKTHYVA